MWKKFCVSILSICILGGAAIISGSLFAADESTLRFTDNTKEHHYVNDEFSYTLTSDRSDEAVLYVGGGELHGGAFTYQVPFYETNTITISDIQKPGTYQGELSAEVRSQTGGSKEISGVLTFTIYGIVYQNDMLSMEPQQQLQPETYGTLPSDVNPIFTFMSDNEAVALIDEKGNIKAVREGTADIHMVVYDGAVQADKRLYESVLRIEVGADNTQSKHQVLRGEENDFRFIQTQPVAAEKDEKQKIGYIVHPQSGAYRYEIAQKDRKQFAIDNGELYALGKQTKGKHSVKVTVIAPEQDQVYEVDCSFEVSAEDKNQNEQFQFRYEGKAVSSIVRPYQEGNNSFQIASNKNLEEVLFQLKNETDSEYLNISQTGNVIIKKISKQPIVITAKWQEHSYECSVMIDKAEQQISVASSEINISPEDGRFDPLINGRMGNGALIAQPVGEAECVSLSYSEQGGLVIEPLKVGDAQIQIYNDGDANYKKSNVITLLIHVREPEVLNKEWLGDAKWLDMQGSVGEEGWFTSNVSLSLKKDAPVSTFHFNEKSYRELQWNDNGETVLPVFFSDKQGVKSTVTKVSFKIDTHAPLITAISERKAADRGWKEFIDELTFQSIFGQGMIIDIQADDALMNNEIKTSGVKEISYEIYRVDEDNKETLLTKGVEAGDNISVQIADTGMHKVCAAAVDHAGLRGEETCHVLNDDVITPIRAENTAMMLYSRAFDSDDHILIQAINNSESAEIVKIVPSSEKVTDIKGYQIKWKDHETAVVNQMIQVAIPTINQDKPAGYWIQRKGSTYQPIETINKRNVQILHLTSLEPIYYVETKRSATAGQLGFYLAKPNDLIAVNDSLNTEVTRVSFQPFTYPQHDLNLVLYAAGAVLVVCFVILLIRSGKEEN